MGRLALYSTVVFLVTLPLYLLLSGLESFFEISQRVIIISPYRMIYLNMLVIASFLLVLVDLFVFPRLFKKVSEGIMYRPLEGSKIGVAMTCYNDEEATGNAVREFLSENNVVEVVAVDNNSTDRTAEVAREAGARVVREGKQGYGYTCMRGLREAKGDIVILVESDMTFRAYDMKKMLAYLENADLVLGTRTTQEFLDKNAQMDWFLNWGNIVLAKLIQIRFGSQVRLTDVGCTYRAIRKDALDKIIDQLELGGNHFSPYMIMVALRNNLKVIEIPVTYSERVGESKATGRGRWVATKLGLQMLWMIFTFR